MADATRVHQLKFQIFAYRFYVYHIFQLPYEMLFSWPLFDDITLAKRTCHRV